MEAVAVIAKIDSRVFCLVLFMVGFSLQVRQEPNKAGTVPSTVVVEFE